MEMTGDLSGKAITGSDEAVKNVPVEVKTVNDEYG